MIPVRKGAILSPCEKYRYTLSRVWNPKLPVMVFCMLNPSTADAKMNDPTIRRCMSFARREECGGIHVVNLFAFRATCPDDMMKAKDPIGPNNQLHILKAFNLAIEKDWPVVAAWGSHKVAVERGKEIAALIPMKCLKVSKTGAPWHPLYVKGDTKLIEYKAKENK